MMQLNLPPSYSSPQYFFKFKYLNVNLFEFSLVIAANGEILMNEITMSKEK